MLKIGVVGIGNAGSQVAKLASEQKIQSLVINSSQSDIETIPRNDFMLPLTIGNKRGSGKDRDQAKEYLAITLKEIVTNEDINSYFTNNFDIIFIISSIDGGTGSGIAPALTEIFSAKYIKTKFILIGIYPRIADSIGNQQNSIEYLQELTKSVTDCTFMCYDNERRSEYNRTKMLQVVNQDIIDDIQILSGLYNYQTPFESIDESDMMKILMTPGRLAVYHIEGFQEKDLDKQTIEDMVIEQINIKSAHVELDRDSVVKRMGIIQNLNETINERFDSDIPKVKNFIGEFIEDFKHISITDNLNRVIVICSGLSIPNDRIEKIHQRMQEGISKMKESKENIVSEIDIKEIKEMRKNPTGVQTNSLTSEDSLNDILNKFRL